MDQTGWGSITGSGKEFSKTSRLALGAHPAYYKYVRGVGVGFFPTLWNLYRTAIVYESTRITSPIGNSCGADDETTFSGRQWNVPHGQQMLIMIFYYPN